jgi:hypothetical protein
MKRSNSLAIPSSVCTKQMSRKVELASEAGVGCLGRWRWYVPRCVALCILLWFEVAVVNRAPHLSRPILLLLPPLHGVSTLKVPDVKTGMDFADMPDEWQVFFLALLFCVGVTL